MGGIVQSLWVVGVSGSVGGGSIVNSGSGIISGERRERCDARCATVASLSRMRRSAQRNRRGCLLRSVHKK